MKWDSKNKFPSTAALSNYHEAVFWFAIDKDRPDISCIEIGWTLRARDSRDSPSDGAKENYRRNKFSCRDDKHMDG